MVATAIAIAMVTGGVANAQPSAPPSKTLERAIALYDKKDFVSATIELYKVLSGETGDGPQNVERARFFLAKTLVHLDFDAAALTSFERIVQTPNHPYRSASAKWLVAIADRRVVPFAGSILWDLRDERDLHRLDDETRGWFVFHVGREAARRGDVTAADRLERVPAGSKARARAALVAAEVAFRKQDIGGGIRLAMSAADDPARAVEAAQVIATWTRLLRQAPRADEAFQKLASGTTPAAGYARFQRSRLAVERAAVPDLSGVPAPALDAVVLGTACGRSTGDLMPALVETIVAGRKSVTTLLSWEDNTEAFQSIARSSGKGPLIDRWLADPDTQEMIGWVAELDRELALLASMDRAWQTTQVAADILQELTVQQSLAQADAGKRLRDRLQALADDLAKLEPIVRRAIDRRVAAGPDPSHGGFVVTADVCGGTVAAAANGPTPSIATSPNPTPRPHGCGGCATGDDSGGLALLAFAIALSARRHGSRRRQR
jgi:hypothetical protein